MNQSLPISIILATYNRARTLRRAISSVLDQTYGNFELLIVDDGSTDDTVRIVEEYTDRRIRYLSLPVNCGAGAARNAGIRAAQHELMAFQDSDDEWFPDKLAVKISSLTEETGLVHHDVVRVNKCGAESILHTPDNVPPGIIERFSTVGDIGIVWCLTRTALIRAVGGFDESLAVHGDTDILIKLRAVCSFRRIPRPLMYYHESDDALSTNWTKRAESLRKLLHLHSGELAPFRSFIAKGIAQCARLENRDRDEHQRKF